MLRPAAVKTLRRAGVYLVAVAGLVWVFHDVEWTKLARNIAGLDWGWVALALLLDVTGYAIQGVRWSVLLRPLGRLSSTRATEAVFTGLFVNEVVPLHLGEIARAFPVCRWLAVPLVAVVPSMALERLFDGIWLAAGVGLTAVFVPLPRNLLEAGDIFGLAVIALTAGLVFLMVRKTRDRAGDPVVEGRPRRRYGWILGTLRQLEAGLRSIGLSRLAALAFLMSVLIILFQALALWLLLKAYGLSLAFWVAGAVFLILRLGTVLPGAPGNLGLYQLFCVLGLTLFGVDKTSAAGFSIVAFVLMSVPLWVLGALALGRTGMTLASIKAKIKEREKPG